MWEIGCYRKNSSVSLIKGGENLGYFFKGLGERIGVKDGKIMENEK